MAEEEMNYIDLAIVQRFLDEEAKEGKEEIEAMRKLMRILGVEWHGTRSN